jgi:fatty-acyl-CoA synthase
MSLEQTPANFQPLTPITFLARTADATPGKTAIIHGDRRISYSQYYANTRRLASALIALGLEPGETVSVMAANIPAFLDAHYGVPMAGGVLNALNNRLDAKTLAFTLDHAECKILLTDTAFAGVMREALELATVQPVVIDIDDLNLGAEARLGSTDYEALLSTADPDYSWGQPTDEWQSLALNYTSGTTGNPKGVVYSHRGAYLNAIGNTLVWPLDRNSVYLWTLPMFHCNGWCFPWTVAATGATHVCLRGVEVEAVIEALKTQGITHLCGAPVVLNMVLNAPKVLRQGIPTGIKVLTAGAPPPAAILQGMESMGFDVTQGYGLTEVYGPCVISEWHDEWDSRPAAERAALKARQGIRYPTQEHTDVLDSDTMTPVPADGETMGEIMFRGNTTMKGYFKNPDATREAFAGGWFHSGDLAVKHPDGYIEIRDRSKDIIISGGENISSVEVEGVLYQHPAIMEAAVVAMPHEKWGETPCAFVGLKPGEFATEADIITFCRDRLAHFKCPGSVLFGELPKTSTGKIQKFLLREKLS